MQSGTNEDHNIHIYRCRKCRIPLNISDAVIGPYSDACLLCLTTIDLDYENCPEWIQDLVNKSGWTRGKIHCVKCSGRLGSFDFVRDRTFQGQNEGCCHQHSSVHLLRDRVDECLSRASLTKTSMKISPHRPACSKPTSLAARHPAGCLGVSGNGAEPTIGNCDNVHASALCDINHNSAVSNSVHLDADELRYRKHLSNSDDLRRQDNKNIQHIVFDSGGFTENVTVTTHVGELQYKKQLKFKQLDSEVTEKSSSSIADGMITGNRFRLLDCNIEEGADDCEFSRDASEIGGSNDDGNLPLKAKPERKFAPSKGRTNRYTQDKNLVTPDDLRCPPIAELLQEEEIPFEMSCAVCLEVLYSPYKCRPCNHVFCEICLRRIANQRPTLTLCPLCRNLIHNCQQESDLNEEIRQKFTKQYRKQHGILRKMNIHHFPLPRCTRREQVTRNYYPLLRKWSYNVYIACAFLVFLILTIVMLFVSLGILILKSSLRLFKFVTRHMKRYLLNGWSYIREWTS